MKYVPRVAANLVSASKATEAGAKEVFVGDRCQLEIDGEVVLEARKSKGIYVINRAGAEACFLVAKPETAELWHRRLGHAGYENLAWCKGTSSKGLGSDRVRFGRLKPR